MHFFYQNPPCLASLHIKFKTALRNSFSYRWYQMRFWRRRKQNDVAETVARVSFWQVLPFWIFAVSNDVVPGNKMNKKARNLHLNNHKQRVESRSEYGSRLHPCCFRRHFFHPCGPVPNAFAFFVAALGDILPKPNHNVIFLIKAGPKHKNT